MASSCRKLLHVPHLSTRLEREGMNREMEVPIALQEYTDDALMARSSGVGTEILSLTSIGHASRKQI
eukprot:scaffold322871_cov14-Prasinocladus_malaysianus.AAC.1